MSATGDNKRTTSHPERLMREALDIINGSRRSAYGPPERNFERIAALWHGYFVARGATDPAIDSLDVCHMLDLVKLARLVETPDHEDSIRDRFGYQGCYVGLVYGDKPVVEESQGGWVVVDEVVVEPSVEADWKDWPPDPGVEANWPPAVEPIVRDDCDAPVPKFESRLRPGDSRTWEDRRDTEFRPVKSNGA